MLPPESATKTALRDGLTPEQMAEVLAAQRSDAARGHGPWSHTDMRIMALHDVMSWILYALYAVNGAKPEPPNPYPRPGIAPPQTRRTLTAGAVDRLEAMREADRAERIRAGTERPNGRASLTADAATALQDRIRQARQEQDTTTGG